MHSRTMLATLVIECNTHVYYLAVDPCGKTCSIILSTITQARVVGFTLDSSAGSSASNTKVKRAINLMGCRVEASMSIRVEKSPRCAGNQVAGIHWHPTVEMDVLSLLRARPLNQLELRSDLTGQDGSRPPLALGTIFLRFPRSFRPKTKIYLNDLTIVDVCPQDNISRASISR